MVLENRAKRGAAAKTDASAIKRLNLGRIVVPLDGKQESECVLPYALMMAKWWDSELVLLHVIRTLREVGRAHGERVLYPDMHHDRGVQLASAYLDEVSKKLRQHNIRVRWGVASGEMAEMVTSRALASQAGLIILRSSTRSFRQRLTAGAFEHVWRTSPMPLFVVNEPPEGLQPGVELAPPKELIVGVDNKASIPIIIPYLKQALAPLVPANVRVVYPLRRVRQISFGPAQPPIADTEIDQAVVELEELGASVSVEFSSNMLETISDLHDLRAGVWAFTASHMRPSVTRLVTGSVSHALVSKTVSPLMVVPHRGIPEKRIAKSRLAQ